MIVTKYFNKSENWDHYETGSFKIGTLKEYRSVENKLVARMQDSKEGVREVNYGSGSGFIGHLNIERFGTISNFQFEGAKSVLSLTSAFNEHVFCCSLGTYDPEHHRLIRDGGTNPSGSNYLGNSDLDAFAEIDFSRFTIAMVSWLRSRNRLRTRQQIKKGVVAKIVSYGSRSESKPIPSFGQLSNNKKLTLEEYLKVVFTKPLAFEAEKEVRLAVNPHTPNLLIEDAEALYPKSEMLRKSIRRMGFI